MSRRDCRQMIFADTILSGGVWERKDLSRLDNVAKLLDWSRQDRLMRHLNPA